MNINATQQPNQQQTKKPQNTSAINSVLLAKQKVDVAQKELANKQKTAAQKNVDLQSLSASRELEGQSLSEKSSSINQQQAAGAALAAKRGKTDPSQLKGASLQMYKSMTEKQLRDFAKTKHEGLPEKVEESNDDEKTKIDAEDPRSIPTKVNLLKNKLRAAGMRNPIVMVATEETDADRAMAAVRRSTEKKHGDASILGSPAQKAKQAAQPKPKPQQPRKLQGYRIPGAPKEKSYND